MMRKINFLIFSLIMILVITSISVWAEDCPECQNGELSLTWHPDEESSNLSLKTLSAAATSNSLIIGDESVKMTYIKSFKQEKNQWSAPLPLDNPIVYSHDSKILFHLESIKHTNGLDTESWTVQFVFPNGFIHTFPPFKWYKTYQGKSSCFVWGNNILAENTTVLDSNNGWIEPARCLQTGIWKIKLIHDSKVLGTVNMTVRAGCDRDSIVSGATFNQGSYRDRTNELHHMDNACRNKVRETSHFCNKKLHPNEFNTTISMSGCAMTSCCVMLNFYGIQVTPVQLNVWLKENYGYIEVGDIDWTKVVEYANDHNINLKYRRTITESQLESYLCKYGPQVASVKNGHHWVCVYGKDTDGNWVIMDPSGGAKMKLTSKYTRFNTIRGFYLSEVPYTPLPGLTIILRSPAEVLVTDSQGRRTGYDSITGQSYNEISDASYDVEVSDFDDETGEAIDHLNKILYMENINSDTYTVQVTGTGNGTYDLYFRGYQTDKKVTTKACEGVETAPNLIHTYRVRFDGTPGSEIDVSGGPGQEDQIPPVTVADYPSDWVNQDVCVSLAATDNQSGVKETYYRLDGTDWKLGKQIFIAEDGVHTVEFYSIDQVENKEETKSIKVKIDKTPPKTEIKIEGTKLAEGTYKSSAMVTLSASDSGSGVKAVYYRLGLQGTDTQYTAPVVINTEGENLLKVYALDQVGNQETVQEVMITIVKSGDATPPVTVAEYPTGWVNQAVTVYLTATDDQSGVKETDYRVDGGPWQAGREIVIEEEGVHTIDFYSSDRDGNVEKVQTIVVKIDRTAPQSTAEISGVQGEDGTYSGSATVSLSANDTGSGVKSLYYNLDVQGNDTLYAAPFTLTAAGRHNLDIYAVDQVGNEEKKHSYTVTVKEAEASKYYSLLCNQLTVYGNTRGNYLYCNGPIAIYGSGEWDVLGTAESSFTITGQQQIGNIIKSGAKQSLLQPDWEKLKLATALQKETQINTDSVLSGVRFENSLMVSGATQVSGLLVVRGDLTFNGDVELDNACIICSGKMTVNGGIRGTGLVYSAAALTVWGNCRLSGAMVVDGPVTMAGTEILMSVNVEKYFTWFK